jgi:hypothetical protein
MEEEEQHRQQMLAKFAEDDRIEQMNAQKRRMKQQEHKRAVEELLMKRREHYAQDRVSFAPRPVFSWLPMSKTLTRPQKSWRTLRSHSARKRFYKQMKPSSPYYAQMAAPL